MSQRPPLDGAEPLDVLIVGAGPAGAATALALRQAGVRRVGLVHEPPAGPWRIGESATPDVPGLLTRLGVAMPSGHRPYVGNASIWGGPLQFDDFATRGQPMGCLLDRTLFDQQLRDAAEAAGAELIQPARLEAVQREVAGWCVSLRPVARAMAQAGDAQADAPMLRHARVLVDASGRRAALARMLGARRHRLDKQVALAVRCQLPAAPWLVGRALVEACACGWWYAAELPGGELLLSLMTDQDLARKLREPQAWLAALTDSQLYRALPDVTGLHEAAGAGVLNFAAHSGCLNRAAGPGWVALGDALLSLDPLTSSGISGALRDALDACTDVLLPWLEGSPPEPAGRAWGERANRSWLRFLAQRQRMYAQVQHWAQAPYWQRRHTPAVAPAL
jgi:flavin-dependent dehydrogenase